MRVVRCWRNRLHRLEGFDVDDNRREQVGGRTAFLQSQDGYAGYIGTDVIEATRVAEAAAERANASGARCIVLPAIPFGNNNQQLTQAATIQATYPQQLQTLAVIDPKTQVALQATPPSNAAVTTAVGEIATAFKVTPTVAGGRLLALSKLPKADQAFLAAHGNDVTKASAAAPGQWKDWWWVCVGGEVVFLPFILVLTGRWRPRKAREDAEEHERAVQQELAALDQA